MKVGRDTIIIDPEGDMLLILEQPPLYLPRFDEQRIEYGSVIKESENARHHEELEAEEYWEEELRQTRFLVSSQQLKITSIYFRIMFDGKYRETYPDVEDGELHVYAPDWDVDALTAVLDVLHGNEDHISYRVGLDMLVSVAEIVDYYQFLNAVKGTANQWIERLMEKSALDDETEDNIWKWVFVSWIFERSDIFERATTSAILESRGYLIHDLQLPISQSIFDYIEEQRQAAIQKMINCVRSWRCYPDASEEDQRHDAEILARYRMHGDPEKHNRDFARDLQRPFPGRSYDETEMELMNLNSRRLKFRVKNATHTIRTIVRDFNSENFKHVFETKCRRLDMQADQEKEKAFRLTEGGTKALIDVPIL